MPKWFAVKLMRVTPKSILIVSEVLDQEETTKVMEEFYLIRIDRPENVGVKDMKKYIKEAINFWKDRTLPESLTSKIGNVLSVKRLPGKVD